MKLKKLNDKGDYISFPGLTVIALIDQNDLPFWQTITTLVENEAVTPFFSLLPSQSYHVTVMGLETQLNIGSDQWFHYVMQHLDYFQSLKMNLESNACLPIIKPLRFVVSTVICLEVEVEVEQAKIFYQISNDFHQPISKHPFHITLAYQYHEMPHSDKKILENKLNECLGNFTNLPKLTSPKLCYFEDMTAFHHWDAETFPFTRSITPRLSIFNHSIRPEVSREPLCGSLEQDAERKECGFLK